MDSEKIQKCNEFQYLIHDTVSSEGFSLMKKCRHHGEINTYEHSVEVAYLCYKHCRRHKSRINQNELIRGALLHDYYLYDRHDKSNKIGGLRHAYTHPGRSLENAMRVYPDLTSTEKDIIKRHMFPFTPVPPKTRCGWLVCFYDKVAAICDYRTSRKRKKRNGQMPYFNHRPPRR